MELEFVRGTPELMPRIRGLANHVFRSRRPGDMAEEFPHLYDPANASQWFCALDGYQVIGIVGTYRWSARVFGAATTVATLGSVATDPAYRRHGIAGKLLGLAETALKADGVRAVIISGDLPIYRRFGARPVGSVRWWRWTTDGSVDWSAYRVRPVTLPADAGWVARLYQTRRVRLVRPFDLLPRLLAVDPLARVERGFSKPLLAERNGVPVTYGLFLENPAHGSDTSRLTEWAGDPWGLLAAAGAVRHSGRGVLIPAVEEDVALNRVLEETGAALEMTGPYPYLTKIIDGVGWFDDLSVVYRERGAPTITVHEIERDRYVIEVAGEHREVDGATVTAWCLGEGVPPPSLREWIRVPAFWPEGLTYV